MTSCSQPTLLHVRAPALYNLRFLANALTKSKLDEPNLFQNIKAKNFFSKLEIVTKKIKLLSNDICIGASTHWT